LKNYLFFRNRARCTFGDQKNGFKIAKSIYWKQIKANSTKSILMI